MSAFAVMRSGARINLAAPRRDLIRTADIAEALAKMPMYRGATWNFYSVAQHSVLVAQEAARMEGPVAGLYALLHHMEAAFGDPGGAVERFSAAVYGAFNLDWPAPKAAQRAVDLAHDSVALVELRQLRAGCEPEIAEIEKRRPQPYRAGKIVPVSWDRAMDRFVDALKVNAVAAQLGRVPALEGLL